MELDNPFGRIAWRGLILHGDAYRKRWRALPRAERKRLTRAVTAGRTGRDVAEAQLLAGRAWQLQTQYAVVVAVACVLLTGLLFAVVAGRTFLAPAMSGLVALPLGYAWHIRKLTAVVVKNAVKADAPADHEDAPLP